MSETTAQWLRSFVNTDMSSSRFRADRLLTLLAPVVAGHGLDLEDVAVESIGRRIMIRVVVDGDDGVNLDDVAALSRDVSSALDADDTTGSPPYVLEVTSPGIGRPLVTPKHWLRARTRLVSLRLTAGEDVMGRVVGVAQETVTLDVDGARRTVLMAEVAHARVEAELSRPVGAEATGGNR
jgi:ribosome maturation factor RimP